MNIYQTTLLLLILVVCSLPLAYWGIFKAATVHNAPWRRRVKPYAALSVPITLFLAFLACAGISLFTLLGKL